MKKTDLLVTAADPTVPVRDPATGLALPQGGARVPDTPYWRRRLADGDVRIVPPPSRRRRPATPAPAADIAPTLAADSAPAADIAPAPATTRRSKKD